MKRLIGSILIAIILVAVVGSFSGYGLGLGGSNVTAFEHGGAEPPPAEVPSEPAGAEPPPWATH